MGVSGVRIVGGTLKGRNIPSLPGRTVRPTSQRVREALFGILGSRVARMTMADLFAGTGAIGIEALSRGAARVAFVDHQKEQMHSLHQTLSRLNLLPQTLTLTQDIHLAIKNPNLLGWRPFDVLFLDPPYRFPDTEALLDHLAAAELLKPAGVIIYEHFAKTHPPESIRTFARTRIARYGDTVLTFYQSSESIPAEFHL